MLLTLTSILRYSITLIGVRTRINKVLISLNVDGKYFQRNLCELFSSRANATEDERKVFEISPSGYGIHWPLIDEGISINGLIGNAHDDRKQTA